MNSSKTHIPSLLSFLLFILAALLFFSVSLLMGVTALGTLFAGKDVQTQQTILLVITGFEAMILLVAAFIALQRFLQKPYAEVNSSLNPAAWQFAISVIAAGAALLIGYYSGKTFETLLLPILTVPAVFLPLFVVLGIGVRGISFGSRWQSWNVFGIAMTLVPFILVFLEVFAFIAVVILAIAVVMLQPQLVSQVERLSQQMYILGPQSKAAQNLLAPYIMKPGVIVSSLIYFAVLIPMLEEVTKPLGVWFFANKLSTPAQGFALGALSGAGYALIETLGVSAQPAGWASLLLLRVGTGTLHITTSALMGAGIVYAIRERRRLRLFGIYLLCVTMHGLWNGVAILSAFSTIAETYKLKSAFIGIEPWVNIGLGVLAAVYLVVLVLMNRNIRKTLPQPVLIEQVTSSPVVAQPEESQNTLP